MMEFPKSLGDARRPIGAPNHGDATQMSRKAIM
jgi:hypothetical protein